MLRLLSHAVLRPAQSRVRLKQRLVVLGSITGTGEEKSYVIVWAVRVPDGYWTGVR